MIYSMRVSKKANRKNAFATRQTQNIDEPLAMLRSGTTSYYQADGINSITSLSNVAGALAQTYTFDSFGEQTASSGSLTNPFRYTGREFDTETGLDYYRARYYDPNPGRFLAEDPLEFVSTFNPYAYVENRPTNSIDPSGLCRVVLLYFPIKGTPDYHMGLLVANNTGGPRDPWYYRGGPGSGGTYWTPNIFAMGIRPWEPTTPDPMNTVAAAQIILDDQSKCDCIIGNLDNYVRRVNASNIPYHLLSTNSSAFASGAIKAAGLPLPTLLLPTRGWNVPLPITRP